MSNIDKNNNKFLFVAFFFFWKLEMKENLQVSEKEKINSWLEKQILIWNGTPVSKLFGKNKVSQFSPNIKVERKNNEDTKKGKDINKPNINDIKKENSKKTSDEILNKINDNQNNQSSNMKLRFKDWSDLHNYLLVSMKRE